MNRRANVAEHLRTSAFICGSTLREMVSPMPRFLRSLTDNVAEALSAMRQAKGRSALTILGVVIGVSTVMTMATIVRGVQDQIVHTIEIAGPTTFYVMKVFST